MLEYARLDVVKVVPPIVNEPAQSCGVDGVMMPSESAASATTGLNVDLVGYTPCVAWFRSPWRDLVEAREVLRPRGCDLVVAR
jgi:hypothetical protein